MKIEIGENLFYSWLRHVKDCQLVQTNWKTSAQWDLQHEADLELLMQAADKHFFEKYGYSVFKKNASLSQFLQQAECDIIGISVQDGITSIYAVDVAFHEAGLNYGSREATVMKIISKTIRTAMCLWGYMECKNAEIIFASPKINPALINDIEPCIEDINTIFSNNGFDFHARLIANSDFNDTVLQPILTVSNGIADTSELFMRSYQMFNMFSSEKHSDVQLRPKTKKHTHTGIESEYIDESNYKELKIGKLAGIVLRRILEEGSISSEELANLQKTGYSKETFDLQYPLLVKHGTEFDRVRYYSQPLNINGELYYLCSQWFEVPANNDRPYLIRWINQHELQSM